MQEWNISPNNSAIVVDDSANGFLVCQLCHIQLDFIELRCGWGTEVPLREGGDYCIVLW